MGLPNTSREAKLSGANGDREKIFVFVQLTTSRIGYLTRLIYTLLSSYVVTTHTYIPVLDREIQNLLVTGLFQDR